VKNDSKEITIVDAMNQSRQGKGIISPGECNMRDQKLHGSRTAWGSSKSERFPAPKKTGMKVENVPGPAGGSKTKSSNVPDVSGANWKGHTTTPSSPSSGWAASKTPKQRNDHSAYVADKSEF
jgi:hypothetical protein